MSYTEKIGCVNWRFRSFVQYRKGFYSIYQEIPLILSTDKPCAYLAKEG